MRFRDHFKWVQTSGWNIVFLLIKYGNLHGSELTLNLKPYIIQLPR